MLVGDHGRVIPFRHFKALIVGVSMVLILSLCALILLGVMYTRQRGQIGRLQKNLEEMRVQNAKFRDEKDLYLTQLIALQKQTGALPQKPADEPRSTAAGGPPTVDVREAPVTEVAAPKAEEVKEEVPQPVAEPPVQWSADIRNFNVSYDNRQGVLTARFRIYNTSRPKKRLRGRTVVVFKAIGDPPSHWAIVPEVPLHKETPVGKKGRFFNIRNYQTEKFITLRPKNSPNYDIAAVYVFLDQSGELIGTKELPFNVDFSPPTPAKPVVAPPKSEPEKSSSPAQVPQAENAESKQSKPADSVAPSSGQTDGEPPGSIISPESPSGLPNRTTPPGQEQPQSQLEPNGGEPPEPGASEVIPQTPAAEPKPAQEGDGQ